MPVWIFRHYVMLSYLWKNMWVNVHIQLIDNNKKKKVKAMEKIPNNIKHYIYNTSLNVHVNKYT